MGHADLLIVFSKNTGPGRSKSRLARTLGPEAASKVFRELVVRLHREVADLPIEKAVFFSDHIDGEGIWSSEFFHLELQQGSDLGKRMSNAFEWAFLSGYKNVILIGTDIYNLKKQDLLEAFKELEKGDAVLGPSWDGGYYLIGMNSHYPKLFQKISWSTKYVFDQTMDGINNLSLRCKILSTKVDVDYARDIDLMEPYDRAYFMKIIQSEPK